MKKIIYVSALIICVWSLNLNEIKAQIYFGTNTLSATGSALGTGNTSNSSYTFASGQSSQATNSYSFAHGYGVQAYGQYAGSMGFLSYANGSRSYSYGEVARATGSYSYSFGKSVNSTGNHSFAIGNSSTASGLYGYVFGVASQAVGDYSFAIGRYSVTNGNNSYSIGEFVSTSVTNAFTIGRGINSSTALNNNQSNTLMVGFNSDVPTFFVGASSGAGTTGNVGIKTSAPQAPLHLKGNGSSFLMEGTDHTFISFYPLGYSSGRKSIFGYTSASTTTISLKNEISGADIELFVTDTGSINLNGRVWAKQVVVQLTDPWPDFVFSSTYELTSLVQLETFISKNKHLPNVPSAEDVAKNGINIAEMDAILLQKIEELTLYTIAQQKQLDEQKKLLEEQSKLIEKFLEKK